MPTLKYSTRSGIVVTRKSSKYPFKQGLESFRRELDRHRGIYLSSGYEYPGRYSRWDIASVCPPLEIIGFQRDVSIRPLNERGVRLKQMLVPALESHPHWEDFSALGDDSRIRLRPRPGSFPEEARSKQPSVFSLPRAYIEELGHPTD